VPIQFFAYRRLWTVAQESVQPELVFLPEMGALCEGCDFRRQKRRSTRSQERANMAENAVEIQSKYLRTFAMVDLLGMRDPGGGDLSRNSSLETRWYLLPNYLSYATHLFSARWPVLNFAFESYFRERISAPKNTWSRQWSGMTETERANPDYLDTLAEVQFLAGDPDSALLTIDEAIEIAPWDEYFQDQRDRFIGLRAADDRPESPALPWFLRGPTEPPPWDDGTGIQI